tara:strand:+ start:547 stop:1293 length:747 start_codon:yes stop_codon:yes gene_type:complete
MFHYNIRGGLGTQVLQFVNVYADALEKGLTDDRLEITLNFGNYDDWFYSNPGNHIVDLDFISLLFDFEPFPNIKNKIGTNKSNCFNKKSAINMVKYRDKIIDLMKFKSYSFTPFDKEYVLHTRTKDRQLISRNEYIYYMNKFDSGIIIGDDSKFCKSLTEENDNWSLSNNETSVNDWLSLATGNNKVISSFTTYTLAAAYFNPNSKFYILKNDPKKLVRNSDWETVDYFIKEFNNLEYAYLENITIHN